MRAVEYCRVSTDEESQANALVFQIEEAKACIAKNGWTLVDEYVDEGKSATTIKHRDEYKRLCDDMSTDKYDVIVIKSQDRLMRNTKDWYMFIDALVKYRKKLYFYLYNKFYTPDDALITGIKAILAEEYSRELSKKIKNAHKNRQEKGKSILITSRTWGYDKIEKTVVVNESEAKIVKLIFNLCLEGYGSRSISKELSNMGIKSRTGNDFPEGTIRRIIRNPLFMGTVIMNKRSMNFDTKQTAHNPEEQWKIHPNAVPAIVSEDVWKQANELMNSRSTVLKTNDFKSKRVGRNIGKYDLSGKIKCGLCGEPYWRRYRRGYKNPEEQIIDWSCSEYVKRGRNKIGLYKNDRDKKIETPSQGCDNVHIKETDLMNLLSEVSDNILVSKKSDIIATALAVVNDILGEDNIKEESQKTAAELNKYIRQKDLLLDKLLEQTISDEDYKRRTSDIDKKIETIREREKELKEREETFSEKADRIKEIESFMKSVETGDARVPNLIKHIKELLIFPDRIELTLDFYDKIVLHSSGKKNYQYVDTNKYLASVND
ncbi:serine recombinase [Clostridia bacterium]|nr:serine recombinase [Clostridia bacterium]